MRSKESGKVRYAYGVAMALLLGGTAFSLATGQAGAQVAQNAPGLRARAAPRRADVLRRPCRPASAGGGQHLHQAARAGRSPGRPVRGILPPLRPDQPAGARAATRSGGGQPRTREAGSLGSGFIISPDGYIVTNNHLIQGADGTGTVDSVTVITTDRKEYPARIVGRDETSDLALLKIDGHNLPFVQWGDSTRARVGDWVLAIGNPYGLGGTVTAGIISALHRGITGVGAYDRYIQTDAAINMGNSGGPMFDLNGNVIGINSALISPTGASVGIGLAIPAEAAKPVIDALRRGQRPSRGYLGVGLQPLDEDLAPALGLPKDSGEIVRSVVAGGPARAPGCSRATSSSRSTASRSRPTRPSPTSSPTRRPDRASRSRSSAAASARRSPCRSASVRPRSARQDRRRRHAAPGDRRRHRRPLRSGRSACRWRR